MKFQRSLILLSTATVALALPYTGICNRIKLVAEAEEDFA